MDSSLNLLHILALNFGMEVCHVGPISQRIYGYNVWPGYPQLFFVLLVTTLLPLSLEYMDILDVGFIKTSNTTHEAAFLSKGELLEFAKYE